NRPAFGVEALGPVELFEELFAEKQLPVSAVEHIEKTIAIGLQQKLARLALPLGIDEHGRLLRVPVVNIVRRELEIPPELSCLRLQRKDRIAIQVVSQP